MLRLGSQGEIISVISACPVECEATLGESSSDRRKRARVLVRVSWQGLLPEQVEKECQNKANNNACGEGKVESEIVFFD
jgi:hypothetical protein